jgi:outer membrane immunogenic protein
MKTRLGWALASAMLLGGIGSASAADMAVKAPPMPVPVWNWTGFYIGGNVGGIWNDTRDDTYPTGCFLNAGPIDGCGGLRPGLSGVAFNPLRSDSVRLNGSGFTGGGQAGYNWQSGKFVGGIEADINYSGINDGNAINRPLVLPLVGNYVHAETDKLQWFGTVRGRAGFTITPSFLVYVTGGLAFGEVKSASTTFFTSTTDAYAGTLDETRVGYAVGGGGEWMIAPKWSIKAEYLFVDLGKSSYTQVCTVPGLCTAPPLITAASYATDLHNRYNIARVGLDYHFGGPVVAKY